MVTIATMGGDLQPGCLADRLLTGLGQPQINPWAQKQKEKVYCSAEKGNHEQVGCWPVAAKRLQQKYTYGIIIAWSGSQQILHLFLCTRSYLTIICFPACSVSVLCVYTPKYLKHINKRVRCTQMQTWICIDLFSLEHTHKHSVAYTHTCTHTHTRAHIHKHVHTYTNTCTHTHNAHSLCWCAPTHPPTDTHPYTHTLTHTRTHAHTHSLAPQTWVSRSQRTLDGPSPVSVEQPKTKCTPSIKRLHGTWKTLRQR